MDESTFLGVVDLVTADGQTSASLVVPGFGYGPHQIQIAYTGDTDYINSIGTTTVTVTTVPTTTTVVPALASSSAGQPDAVFLEIAPQAGTGVPTGKVAIEVNGTYVTTVAVVTINGKAYAGWLLPTTYGAGTYVVTAVYTGDANDAGSSGSASIYIG